MCAKSLQVCPALGIPMDCSLPGSSVHGILQERILEDCHTLLQGIFPTQGSSPHLFCLMHCWVGSLPLVPRGKPHLLIAKHWFRRRKSPLHPPFLIVGPGAGRWGSPACVLGRVPASHFHPSDTLRLPKLGAILLWNSTVQVYFGPSQYCREETEMKTRSHLSRKTSVHCFKLHSF